MSGTGSQRPPPRPVGLLEFAREVLAVRAGIPVVMTTGYLRAEDQTLARTAGIRELILKPSTMDELARVLDSILRDSGLNERASA